MPAVVVVVVAPVCLLQVYSIVMCVWKESDGVGNIVEGIEHGNGML